MLSLLFGKKFLSGVVCLATAAGSVVATTSCAKKNSNSFSVSWSSEQHIQQCVKIEGVKNVEKSTEYTCVINIDTTKCNFIIDKIKVIVGNNPSHGDGENIWSSIKDNNPKEITSDGIYNLTIPAEYVTNNIYIDLSFACQIPSNNLTVNFTTTEHCTINGTREGKIEKDKYEDIQLAVQFSEGFRYQSISGYYANDVEKNDISNGFVLSSKDESDTLKIVFFTIPKELFFVGRDVINVSVSDMALVESEIDIEKDNDGEPVAQVSNDLSLFMGSKYRTLVKFNGSNFYDDDSIQVYATSPDREKQNGDNITSSCQFSVLDNFKQHVWVNIPVDVVQDTGKPNIYVHVQKPTTTIDITKHFPVIFQNDTDNASDKQVKTTWLQNVWGENEPYSNSFSPIDDSIKNSDKAWTYPVLDISYQFTPLYESKILPGDKNESTIQYVLKDDSFNVYYTIVNDKDTDGQLKHYPIDNAKLTIDETFEDIGTPDDPDQLLSYKVVIPNLSSLLPKSDQEIEIASCVISFVLEEEKCYSLLDFDGNKNFVTMDLSAYNFINPLAVDKYFTIPLFFNEGYTIGDFDLYYLSSDGRTVSFKNDKTADGKEIICNYTVQGKKNVVYIRIPIALIKGNFYLHAPHRQCESDNNFYYVNYDIDTNYCSISCKDDNIKDSSTFGFSIAKENVQSDFNFEIKLIDKSSNNENVTLLSWDVIQHVEGSDGISSTSISSLCELNEDEDGSNKYKLTIPVSSIQGDLTIKVKTSIVLTYNVAINFTNDSSDKLDKTTPANDKHATVSKPYYADFVFKRGYQLKCDSVVSINGKDFTDQCEFDKSSTANNLICTTVIIPSGIINGDITLNIDYEEIPKVEVGFYPLDHIKIVSSNLIDDKTGYIGEELTFSILFKDGYTFSKVESTSEDGESVEWTFIPGDNTSNNPGKLVLSKENNTKPGKIIIHISINESTSDTTKFLGFKDGKIVYHDSYFNKDVDVKIEQKGEKVYVANLPDTYKTFGALNVFANDNPEIKIFKFTPVFANGNDFAKTFTYSLYADSDRKEPIKDGHIIIQNSSETDQMPDLWVTRASKYGDIDYLDISPMVDKDVHLIIPIRVWNAIGTNFAPYSLQFFDDYTKNKWVDCTFNSRLNSFYWDYDFLKLSNRNNNTFTMSLTTRPGYFDVYTLAFSKNDSNYNPIFGYNEYLGVGTGTTKFKSSVEIVKTIITYEDPISHEKFSLELNSLCYTFQFSMTNLPNNVSDHALLAYMFFYINGSLCSKCALSQYF